jgi:hypothetical protein
MSHTPVSDKAMILLVEVLTVRPPLLCYHFSTAITIATIISSPLLLIYIHRFFTHHMYIVVCISTRSNE